MLEGEQYLYFLKEKVQSRSNSTVTVGWQQSVYSVCVRYMAHCICLTEALTQYLRKDLLVLSIDLILFLIKLVLKIFSQLLSKMNVETS